MKQLPVETSVPNLPYDPRIIHLKCSRETWQEVAATLSSDGTGSTRMAKSTFRSIADAIEDALSQNPGRLTLDANGKIVLGFTVREVTALYHHGLAVVDMGM